MKGLPLGRTLRQLRPTPGHVVVFAGVAAVGGLTGVALLSDHLLERLYDSWRPRLERQVGRIMGRPLQLGPYQGLSADGLQVGPSRFLGGPRDGSTASVTSLRVRPDPLASLRRRQLVLEISLTGARADLRPNSRGQVWVLGSLPPGGEPPPLELNFRVLRQAELRLHGFGDRPEPFTMRLAGHVGVFPRQRRLDGRARAWLPGGQGIAVIEGGGNWQRRLWQGSVLSQRLPLSPLQRLLPPRVRLDGHADGRLRLGLEQGRFRCAGTLQLRAVRWRQPGLDGPISGERLPLSCDDSRLSISASPWRYGRWGGLASAVLEADRSLAVRLTARPPAGLRLPSGTLRGVLRGRWQRGALRAAQVDLSSGASSLQARGTVGRTLDLAGWWRLDPADLPRADRLPIWLRRQPIGGRFSLAGPLGSPSLDVATRLQADHPLFGAWQASLRWDRGLLQLIRLDADRLTASATLPLSLRRGRGLSFGPLEASIDLRDFPLAAFGPLVGTRLQGRLDGHGRVRGPLDALVPEFELAVRDPAAGPLRLREFWSGRLEGIAGGGGWLRLRAQPPGLEGRITARLDRRWLPQDLLLERGGGTLSLRGEPRLYRWQARALPLQGLELLPSASVPAQPLQGLLAGSGQLGLQPLAFSGQVALQHPGVFGLSGRELTASLRYGERRYSLRGSVQPLSGGRIEAELSGRWRGPFQARFQGRQLSSLLFREIARAWDGWRGVLGLPRGGAADLGQPAIATLGMALQDQLAVLDQARERLQELEQQERRATRAERLARLQMRVDADLSVRGPDLRRARARLDGRGHLWLSQQDRDLALSRDPFQVRLDGPLFQGAGSFSLSGLTLSLLSLLTPVPDSLRGYLAVAGRYRLGGRRPELEMQLSLDQAELADTGLRLERGRLDLDGNGLDMDLALQADGASSTVDLAGLLPLDTNSKALELRLASRGDGLRFLTGLVSPALQWRKGSVDLRLLVRGSLQDPIANGFLRFREGEYGFIGQTLQGVEATVLFDFQQLLLQELSARVGPRGRLTGEGRLGLVRPLGADPTLSVRLEGVPFAMERIKAVADGRLELAGSLTAPALGGRVAISRGVINASPGQLARLEEASPGRGKPARNGPGSGARPPNPGLVTRPTSMNELLQRRWDFSEPLVLLGPEVDSSTNLSLQEAIPDLPWLRFDNLQLAFGPDLRVVLPAIANFTTGGSLRISGRLDPSLRASGVVRLLRGRLNLFTTTFSLDPDAPNVAVFTPSLGLVPYLDIALRTRIADNLNAFGPSGLGDSGVATLTAPTDRQSPTGLSPLSQIKLVRVTVSVSGPADRIADNLRLRSDPPLPQERLVALIGGNSLAGLQGGQASTALATALGQSLLSPVLASLSDALGQRVSFALYPTYVNQTLASGEERLSGRVPPQLVLAGEVGLDLTERVNVSVLAAPNRSDVPAQINLNYKASSAWNVGASVDTQGAWQTVLQFFFRF